MAVFFSDKKNHKTLCAKDLEILNDNLAVHIVTTGL